jgi:putative endonuclease
MHKEANSYYVYMLANKGRMVYTGVTGDLFRRVRQHRNGIGSKFTKKYSTHSLVWFEEADDIAVAIETEKRIKSWRRQWKLVLVEAKNPEWRDLADGWYEQSIDPESSSG